MMAHHDGVVVGTVFLALFCLAIGGGLITIWIMFCIEHNRPPITSFEVWAWVVRRFQDNP